LFGGEGDSKTVKFEMSIGICLELIEREEKNGDFEKKGAKGGGGPGEGGFIRITEKKNVNSMIWNSLMGKRGSYERQKASGVQKNRLTKCRKVPTLNGCTLYSWKKDFAGRTQGVYKTQNNKGKGTKVSEGFAPQSEALFGEGSVWGKRVVGENRHTLFGRKGYFEGCVWAEKGTYLVGGKKKHLRRIKDEKKPKSRKNQKKFLWRHGKITKRGSSGMGISKKALPWGMWGKGGRGRL